jgi:hypothetical protein
MLKINKFEQVVFPCAIVLVVCSFNALAQITTTCERTITGGVICETVDQDEVIMKRAAEARLKILKERDEHLRIRALYPEWQRGYYTHQVATPQGINKICYYRGREKFYLAGKYEDNFYLLVKANEECPRQAETSTVGYRQRKVN